MIINSKGEVLLGKRHDDPEKADSLLHGEGTWSLPGGKLDFGEGLKEAAAREALEETGIKADAQRLELVSIGNEVVTDAHFVTVGFACRDFQGQPKAMEPDEITGWEWFPLDSLPEPMFRPALKVIENYKARCLYNER